MWSDAMQLESDPKPEANKETNEAEDRPVVDLEEIFEVKANTAPKRSDSPRTRRPKILG